MFRERLLSWLFRLASQWEQIMCLRFFCGYFDFKAPFWRRVFDELVSRRREHECVWMSVCPGRTDEMSTVYSASQPAGIGSSDHQLHSGWNDNKTHRRWLNLLKAWQIVGANQQIKVTELQNRKKTWCQILPGLQVSVLDWKNYTNISFSDASLSIFTYIILLICYLLIHYITVTITV